MTAQKRRKPKRDVGEAPRKDVYPEIRTCWHCGTPMKESYRSARFVVTLGGPVHLVSHAFRCPVPTCPGHRTHYRPEAEDRLALRGRTFGLDVLAWIGELRFGKACPMPEIHRRLTQEDGVSISEKEVEVLADAFLALVTTVARHDETLLAALRQQGKLVLAMDGVQPEKGNETLYLLRDVLSGRILVAANLLSSATPEIEALIQEVLDLGLPIVGVISDKQESIVQAIRQKLSGVPHQLCQYHYLKDLSQPFIQADRTFKKEVRKALRGVRPVERALEGPEGQALPLAEREGIADYTLALRTVLTDEGKYPLEPPGLSLYERLTAIRASLQRCLARRPSPLLQKLLTLLAVLDRFRPTFDDLQQVFRWIVQIVPLLEVSPPTTPSQAYGRLGAFVHDLGGQIPSEARFLQGVVTHFEKLTRAFGPALFQYLAEPLVPRTNNELELFIGQLKKFARRITGRKNTHAFILRQGRYAAVLFSLPPDVLTLRRLAIAPAQAFQDNLAALQRRTRQSKKWHIKRHLEQYLQGVENHWNPGAFLKAS